MRQVLMSFWRQVGTFSGINFWEQASTSCASRSRFPGSGGAACPPTLGHSLRPAGLGARHAARLDVLDASDEDLPLAT